MQNSSRHSAKLQLTGAGKGRPCWVWGMVHLSVEHPGVQPHLTGPMQVSSPHLHPKLAASPKLFLKMHFECPVEQFIQNSVLPWRVSVIIHHFANVTHGHNSRSSNATPRSPLWGSDQGCDSFWSQHSSFELVFVRVVSKALPISL